MSDCHHAANEADDDETDNYTDDGIHGGGFLFICLEGRVRIST
jgi:hypothetical protein